MKPPTVTLDYEYLFSLIHSGPKDFYFKSSFTSSSKQNDVVFLNYGPIYFIIDDKAAYGLGRGFLVIDRSLHANSTQRQPKELASSKY